MQRLILAGSILLLGCAIGALAQQPARTGTYLDTRALQREIEVFSPADIIERIRSLLAAGDKAQALQLALQHVQEVQGGSSPQDSLRRYYAYNSLCTVYASLGDSAAAISACNSAINAEPGRWSAHNNRGTARLLAGDYAAALADYQAAAQLAPANDAGIQATLEHNIALARAGLDTPD